MILPIVVANEYDELFKPLSDGYKALVRLAGKPLYRHMADLVSQIFGKAYVAIKGGVEDRYNVLDVEGGSISDAVMAAGGLSAIADRLLIADGAVITELGAIRALVETMASTGADGAILAVPTRRREEVLVSISGGYLAGVSEEGQLAYGGIMLIPNKASRLFEGSSLRSALASIAAEFKIGVAVWGGKWFKVEEPLDLVEALELVMPEATYISAGAKVSPTAVIEGPVHVEAGAEIDHYAVIKGPAYIGENAFIGAHALVRNFSDVEEGSVVGSSAEITHSLVGPRSTIGRGSFISYSVVGEGAVVEPGVLTKSVLREGRERLKPIEVRGRELYKLGALIGKGARIEAGSILKPGEGFI